MVDAIPSGRKLFSKVVFMKQGRRFGPSAKQTLDVWCRWKAGQTLHEIGRGLTMRVAPPKRPASQILTSSVFLTVRYHLEQNYFLTRFKKSIATIEPSKR
jgi:hypothetical protein